MSTLAFIPARGGSKGLPARTREPSGEPLISRSIRIAKSATLVDEVVVNTDDPKSL